MAILKCKMCGGDIISNAEQTFGTCDSCGTTSTLPKVSDEQRANLFNRANHFRRQNEFDKALSAYENILNIDAADAEAHWGVVLSRYGIEYVNDPVTGKKVPTCHRVQLNSILTDADYLAALENVTDGYTRSLYEDEAKAIAQLQREILNISSREEPYDVFICYKETSDAGTRTKDSTLAQDIYYQLANDGYKVFFSRITLEKKLGQEYEPYIFAALNSAKVMVVVGTTAENFSAVWVKNEWSRYLALMKTDRSKLLIPCYMGMDVYDLPEALSMLQSQDMSKIGFMQDLIRGIRKVLDATKASPQASAAGTDAPIAPGASSLLERGKLFLEDKNWASADEYFDRVLDIDPKCAPAYIGKLCAMLNLSSEEELATAKRHLTDFPDYGKALRFANAAEKQRWGDYQREIIYAGILSQKAGARTEQEFIALAKEFRQLGDYKDAQSLALECDKSAAECAEQAKKATYEYVLQLKERAKHENDFKTVAQRFREMGDYADAQNLAKECDEMAAELVEQAKRAKYENIFQAKERAKTEVDFRSVAQSFRSMGDYADAEYQAAECDRLANKVLEMAKKRRRTIKRLALAGTCIVVAVAIFITLLMNVIIPSHRYDQAVSLMNNGEHEQANAIFSELGLTEVHGWTDIVAVSTGNFHTAGLRSDGTAVAVGDNYYDKTEVQDWTDIVAISAGVSHTVGLRSDGTVVAVGSNENGQTELQDWMDIAAISAGLNYTVGLHSDGTVIAVGDNRYGQTDVQDWTDIIAVSAGDFHTVGLRSNGRVVAVGYNYDGETEVQDWMDIVAVSAGNTLTVGLRSDGTVVAVGNNNRAQTDVQSWTDIVAVSAGLNHTIGLRSDGTVVAVGHNGSGQTDVQGWTDIVAVSAGASYTVGLRSDGILVAVGRNDDGQTDVQGWTDIRVPEV